MFLSDLILSYLKKTKPRKQPFKQTVGEIASRKSVRYRGQKARKRVVINLSDGGDGTCVVNGELKRLAAAAADVLATNGREFNGGDLDDVPGGEADLVARNLIDGALASKKKEEASTRFWKQGEDLRPGEKPWK